MKNYVVDGLVIRKYMLDDLLDILLEAGYTVIVSPPYESKDGEDTVTVISVSAYDED